MKKLILSIVLSVLFVGIVFPQGIKIPLIGSKAPSFTEETTNGQITFPDDFGKKWKILFSHPQDFTPVCSSELLELAYMQKEFDQLGVKLAVISTSDLALHKMWKAHLESLDYKGRGPQKIQFPLFDDHQYVASKLYGMLHEPESTNMDIRGVFIIDSKNIVRAINFYPMKVGRNIKEIVRIVEALQTSDKASVLTPANWNPGEDVLVGHLPYTEKELADNPKLKNDYYSVGDRMWFKKGDKSGTADKN
ncbi:MAG TPA: peroxiredoxin [Prolixibacteraceae bacterium]|jgi:peroxiredoxin (alkyl hydroperoxide reductase subunit C)|nr:peroxiredoxin [Prolixibacteraceae bacterium]